MSCQSIVLEKIEVRKNFFKILIKCNYCGKNKWVHFNVLKNGGGKFCSTSCSAKSRPNPNKDKKFPEWSGEKHHQWKGGRRKTINGYILIYQPNHPNKHCSNTVLEHRLVVEKYLNRYLLLQETPHHINGIKDDNRIENLYLFSTKSEHMSYHQKLQRTKPINQSNLIN